MEGLILEGKEISWAIYNAACTRVGRNRDFFLSASIAQLRGGGKPASGGCSRERWGAVGEGVNPERRAEMPSNTSVRGIAGDRWVQGAVAHPEWKKKCPDEDVWRGGGGRADGKPPLLPLLSVTNRPCVYIQRFTQNVWWRGWKSLLLHPKANVFGEKKTTPLGVF